MAGLLFCRCAPHRFTCESCGCGYHAPVAAGSGPRYCRCAPNRWSASIVVAMKRLLLRRARRASRPVFTSGASRKSLKIFDLLKSSCTCCSGLGAWTASPFIALGAMIRRHGLERTPCCALVTIRILGIFRLRRRMRSDCAQDDRRKRLRHHQSNQHSAIGTQQSAIGNRQSALTTHHSPLTTHHLRLRNQSHY
jgi:hypothetical protein